MSISDERLAEIADAPTDYGITMQEICDIATELQALRAIREGDGEWVIVPRKPTPEMKLAANKAVAVVTPDGTWALALDEAARTYAVMIAASPIPATGGEKE